MTSIIVGSIYIICCLALFAYGMQCYILTFLYLRKRKEKLEYHHKVMKYFEDITNPQEYPLVVTQLPMYNEKTVARRIIEAVCSIDYPISRHEIQVLDDSTDDTKDLIDQIVSEYQKKGYKISVIRRKNRIGFKAGALQNGLKYTNAEFVAIFDSDFVPPKDFLKKTLSFFMKRPKLGLVQARWGHLNSKSSLVTMGQAMGIDGHFMVEQAARSWNNLFMNFNGTAGVFRRAAIESCGGWHHDTLTEDMDLSYRMQLNDWESEYVPEIEVPAELPEDINAFKNQQFRWAKGSIQTALKIIPLLKKKKVSPFKFFQAILHLTHYSVHPLMLSLAFLTVPVLFLINIYLHPVLLAVLITIMILSTSGPITMYMVSQHYLGNKIRKKIFMIPVMMLIGTGLAVNNAKAVIEALMKKDSEFLRTPKKGQYQRLIYKPFKDITWLIELLCGLYCLVGLWFFIGFSNVIISPFLVLYSSGFLFIGILSIIHYNKPDLISVRLKDFLKN